MANVNTAETKITNGKATAAMILGILSIVSIIIPIASLILGVTGLILGILGRKEIKRFQQEGRKMALAGIICSVIGILLPIILTVLTFMAYSSTPTSI
ncbi:DUF4190 domain-containing protein [Bacillus sp. KH172YL63]|uniref:DUF4190 domain-containing protein n=1 Tax=Bacillus sp. KH172YL63 TaxID=2709784 RepID=UPI0013E4F45D|nr:DUF4190 domain-containing protein [Bacillus sp. KH172YL63]BCB04201.1 hypothetical protein KH172YL63_23340 [Bacillus sp. KH172YL63]